ETQEISVDNAQPIVPVTNADIAAVLAALKQTTEALQRQNQRLDAQNLKLDALERNQRPRRSNSRSSPRRHHMSATPPPRHDNSHQKCPALERLQQSPQENKKRDRTPPREDRVSPTTKKGNRLNDP
ncbi:hypothetical protein A2U01_0059493, partial [Trifolium medium]|nr:hypothetical protein [Trifolium medium]